MPSQLKAKCSKCGGETGVTKKVYAKRLIKFGSVEKLEASYVCRNCRQEGQANRSEKRLGQKIQCISCGKTVSTNPIRNKQLISEFGTIEVVMTNFKCRSCKSTHRKNTSCNSDNSSQVSTELPSFMKGFKKGTTRPIEYTSVCLRPDTYLLNDRSCGKCEYWSKCQSKVRCKTK